MTLNSRKGCCRRKTKAQVRKVLHGKHPDSDSDWETCGTCQADSVAWRAKGDRKITPLSKGACASDAGREPVEMLVEDMQTSDVSGMEASSGSYLAALCPEHAYKYLALRGPEKCAVQGCQKTWTKEYLGTRYCIGHVPSAQEGGGVTSTAGRRNSKDSKSTVLLKQVGVASMAGDIEPKAVKTQGKYRLAYVQYGVCADGTTPEFYRFLALFDRKEKMDGRDYHYFEVPALQAKFRAVSTVLGPWESEDFRGQLEFMGLPALFTSTEMSRVENSAWKAGKF